jgi:TolB-like protein/DNA-binding winged helix-turn-helix (wHTH) protein
MEKGSSQPRTYKFAVFEVNISAGELRKHGARLKLPPQPFQVLQYLLEHPQEMVTREELRQCLWPDQAFGDHDVALKKAVNLIRTALGDSAESPRFIETIPRRGYRFLAPVSAESAPIAGITDGQSIIDQANDKVVGAFEMATGDGRTMRRTASSGWRKRTFVVAALGLAILIAAELGWKWHARLKATPIRSIAVLPLENLSNDPGQEYFSEGMTDALITDLAQIGSLKVISRTSSMQYKQTKKSLPEIARELGVDGIIEGTVQRSGDRVRITAQLIYGASDRHIWAKSYERNMRDVFLLEEEVTAEIARQIQANLTSNNGAVRTQPKPMDLTALEAFLQGNYHMNKQWSGSGDEEKKKAAEYFQQAITADPNFAPAYRGLALAHENRLLGSGEDFAIVKKAMQKVVEIDPHYSPGRVNLAVSKWVPGLDWRGAEEDLRQAIALDPNGASGHSALCNLLVVMGRVDEGLQECRIALRVDPFDEDSALGFYLGRDYNSSIAMLRMMIQRDPKDGYAHCYLFPDYMMKAMEKESIQELGQCFLLFGHPEMAANIQRAFEASGYRSAIRQWATEIEHLQDIHRAFLPANLAMAYTTLGDSDRAFYWLNQAYEHREMTSFDEGVFYLRAEPMFDPLRSDARFTNLLQRIGLPQ